MSEPADAPADLLEGTERALRRAGLRATQQRCTILAALMQSDDHPTADELFGRTRALDETVSFATVYRTLGALEAAGLIRRVPFGDASARYEITPPAEHDHLVDVDTGAVIEIASAEMERLRARLAAELGYEIVSQQTVIHARRKRR